jgi:hypothetical protein
MLVLRLDVEVLASGMLRIPCHGLRGGFDAGEREGRDNDTLNELINVNAREVSLT